MHHDKFQIALKLVQLITTSNLFSLEITQKLETGNKNRQLLKD